MRAETNFSRPFNVMLEHGISR